VAARVGPSRRHGNARIHLVLGRFGRSAMLLNMIVRLEGLTTAKAMVELLGRLEHEIMTVMWRSDRAAVRDVHSTVKTSRELAVQAVQAAFEQVLDSDVTCVTAAFTIGNTTIAAQPHRWPNPTIPLALRRAAGRFYQLDPRR
jgi:hypothetical protein